MEIPNPPKETAGKRRAEPRGGQVNVACLVEARNEYIDRLSYEASQCVYESLKSLFNDSKEYTLKNYGDEADDDTVQHVFVEVLNEIPAWNSDTLSGEVTRMQEKCPLLPQLLRKVFVYNSQILGALNSKRKIQVKIPGFDKFVHQVYKLTGDLLNEPYAFVDDKGRICKKEHLHDIRKLVIDALKYLMPLQQFVDNEDDEQEDEDEVEEEEEEKTQEVASTDEPREDATGTEEVGGADPTQTGPDAPPSYPYLDQRESVIDNMVTQRQNLEPVEHFKSPEVCAREKMVRVSENALKPDENPTRPLATAEGEFEDDF